MTAIVDSEFHPGYYPAMRIWKPKRNLPLRIRRIAVIVFFFTAIPVPELLLAGAGAIVVGSILLVLAYGTLLKREELATTGLYASCRHPAYFAMLVSGIGFCLASGWHIHSLILSAAYVVISVPLYYRKIRFEEERLVEIHGPRFEEYAGRVKRKLVPSLLSAIRNGGFATRLSFEASIRNHSFKRVAKDTFWFLTFVGKWCYLEGFYPFGRIGWTDRTHNWLLSAALAAALALFILFKYLDHRYRAASENESNRAPEEECP